MCGTAASRCQLGLLPREDGVREDADAGLAREGEPLAGASGGWVPEEAGRVVGVGHLIQVLHHLRA
jgi:hypothetical protein